MAEPAAVPDEGGSPLPAGSTLHEFRIERVLGEGGFGIVYLAHDLQLQRTVALKEYMPASLAARQTGFGVAVRSERLRETFDLGLRSFVNEARLLASFDHPSLVKVYRFWEQNGTAYMVMPYYDGPTLKAWLRQQPMPPDEDWLKRLLHPLLDALELIHADRCFHRDIAPDNILLLGAQNRPLLLDFGAARRVIGDATQALTTILKPGYAPIEQYAEVPSMKQGAWTDVYALCAVLYAALTGRPPEAAVARMLKDEMVPISQLAAGRYSVAFLRAIDAGLALRPEQRPQSISELRASLFAFEVLPGDTTVVRTQPDGEATIVVPAAAHARRALEAGAGATETAALSAVVIDPVREQAPAAPSLAAPSPTPAVAGPRKLLVAAAMAGLAIVAAGVWYVSAGVRHVADPRGMSAEIAPATTLPPTTTPPTDPRSATAPPDTPATPVVAARAPFSPSAVLEDLVRHADPQVSVRVQADKERIAIGRDRMSFRVLANEAGYLYVFLAGTDQTHLALLFPNAIDRTNRIAAGSELVLPRKGWQITAGGPPGNDQIVALVSRQPRDFSAAGLKQGDTIPEFDLTTLQRLWGSAAASAPPLAGEVQCSAGATCDARFGAAMIRIEEFTAK